VLQPCADSSLLLGQLRKGPVAQRHNRCRLRRLCLPARKSDQVTRDLSKSTATADAQRPFEKEEFANEKAFISHAGVHKDSFAMLLRKELNTRKIKAFVDERDILPGQAADMRMRAACQHAKLVIIVVTREFLRSSYCMDELRWALEQRRSSPQQLPMILPVLYPSGNVRGYTRTQLKDMTFTNLQEIQELLTEGSINVDQLDPLSMDLQMLIEQHSQPSQPSQRMPGQNRITLEQRATDLKELASICHQSAHACARGGELVVESVAEAAQRMLAPYMKLLNVPIVGFDKPIQEVQSALGLAFDNVEMAEHVVVGVHGMGGTGKTTLARAVYDAAATTFFGHRVFLSVGQLCKSEEELSNKRRRLLKELSNNKKDPFFANRDEERERLRNVLRSRPPKLLLLDDLWTSDQLHWLLACDDTGNPQTELDNMFPGSRVLITSRDQRIISAAGTDVGVIELSALNEVFSEQLLCHEAFGTPFPPPQFTRHHMEQALTICGGLPLALQVLGRQLSQERDAWKEVLKIFSFSAEDKTIEAKLVAVLRMSYDQLPSDLHRQMFLDAALMLRGCPSAHLKAVWQGVLFHTSYIDLEVVPPRARGESSASFQSRKCEGAAVSAERLLTDLCELSMVKVDHSANDDRIGDPRAGSVVVHDCLVELAKTVGHETHAQRYTDDLADEVLGFRVTRLQWVHMEGSPSDFQPLRHILNGITPLELLTANCAIDYDGDIEQGTEIDISRLLYLRALACPSILDQAVRLRVLDLRDSSYLQLLPDSISSLSRLQWLNLTGCGLLRQLPASIAALADLRDLDLGNCSSLQQLPTGIAALTDLRRLNLGGCQSLLQLPSINALTRLTQLHLRECSSLRQLPDDFSALQGIQMLDLSGCTLLQRLPDDINALTKLEELNLRGCSTLQQLPNSIGTLPCLRALELMGCSSLLQLPDGISALTKLEQLDLERCSSLQQLPKGIGTLTGLLLLDLAGCSSLKQLPNSIGRLTNLRMAQFRGCSSLQQLPNAIGTLASLQELNLRGCTSLQHLPDNIGGLAALTMLQMRGCHSLQQLPDGIGRLTSLQELNLMQCSSLQELNGISALIGLRKLDITGCSSLRQLPVGISALTGLRELIVTGCHSIERAPDITP